MGALQELRLDYNLIRSIPDSFVQGLTALQELRLNDNLITLIPDSFVQNLTTLQYLYLNNNAITSVPDSFGQGLTALQILYLQNNTIECSIISVSIVPLECDGCSTGYYLRKTTEGSMCLASSQASPQSHILLNVFPSALVVISFCAWIIYRYRKSKRAHKYRQLPVTDDTSIE